MKPLFAIIAIAATAALFTSAMPKSALADPDNGAYENSLNTFLYAFIHPHNNGYQHKHADKKRHYKKRHYEKQAKLHHHKRHYLKRRYKQHAYRGNSGPGYGPGYGYVRRSVNNYNAGRNCHPTSKSGRDHYGRRAHIGGTMCYDHYGNSFIVEGSRYVISYY